MEGLDLRIPAHRETVGLEIARSARGVADPHKTDIEAYAVAVTSGTLQDILHTYGALGAVAQDLVNGACKRGIAQLEKSSPGVE